MADLVVAKLHDWRIEDREYGRQEQWRGRRHAFEHLHSQRTALAVIDIVPATHPSIAGNLDALADAAFALR